VRLRSLFIRNTVNYRTFPGSSLKDLKCTHSDYGASDESRIVIFRHYLPVPGFLSFPNIAEAITSAEVASMMRARLCFIIIVWTVTDLSLLCEKEQQVSRGFSQAEFGDDVFPELENS